jgi:hypothetical protein
MIPQIKVGIAQTGKDIPFLRRSDATTPIRDWQWGEMKPRLEKKIEDLARVRSNVIE